MGTIVGIFHDQPLPARGKDLLASMYFLYGPYLELVIALGDGVYDFAVAGKGRGPERFLSNGRPLRLPEQGTIYGVGGLREKWTPRVRAFVERLERRQLTLRYSGSFVGDYNQVLKKGGFFAYPELVGAPQGKYRLQFEANPVAFITEKAGGKGSTGTGRILEVEPLGIAQRVPTYVGTADLISEFEAFGWEKS
jgi:fructose-1,6-bisphosphatase I